MGEETDQYEPLDAEQRRMFGIFDNIGYSADPLAIFRTEQDCEDWLTFDKSRGDDRAVMVDVCILPIDGLTGKVWNSTDPAPVRHSARDLATMAVERAVDTALGEAARQGGTHQVLIEARGAGLSAAKIYLDAIQASALEEVDVPGDDPKHLWREVDEAMSPSNARAFDGDNNYKKCLVITTCIVGGDKGEPLFVLDAKSPRSVVNNLGMSINWSTNERAEAAAFLRKLAVKIEESA